MCSKGVNDASQLLRRRGCCGVVQWGHAPMLLPSAYYYPPLYMS